MQIKRSFTIGASGLLITASASVLSAQTPLADSFNPGADNDVHSLAVQADGKILVAGWYITTVAGQSRADIARLNADGTLDGGINLALTQREGYLSVGSLALQADGKTLLGGHFAAVNGRILTNLARLNADGTVDEGFNPEASGDSDYPDGVSLLAVQADGKILVGEGCAYCQGALVRLNADGTKDGGFFPARVPFGPATIAIQADCKILIGGYFMSIAGQPRTNIARLNPDGTVDETFNPGAAGYSVRSIALQPDGKILVAGLFGTDIARLNPDGTLDTVFNPGMVGWVSSLALQTDGKIILGGPTVGGQPRIGLARLNADGSMDDEFKPGVDGTVNPDGSSDRWVWSLVVQADGKVLVGGRFTILGGQARTNIGRLNNTGSATQNLSYNGSTITWLRGGTSPEVWRTTLETSTDGVNWISLGAGRRVPGGWQLTNVSVATGATIRARGFVAGGGFGEGMLEATMRAAESRPLILTGDGVFGVRSNRFGFSISGTTGQVVVVEGSTNLLQWVPLQTNTLGNSPLYFSDPNWRLKPQQFYRTRLQ